MDDGVGLTPICTKIVEPGLDDVDLGEEKKEDVVDIEEPQK